MHFSHPHKPEKALPFLMRFMEPVRVIPEPEGHYDAVAQKWVSSMRCGATQYARSIQRGTTTWRASSNYEDYDEEYKITTD